MSILFCRFSEHPGNRSLEQNRPVVQMLSHRRWAPRSYCEALGFCFKEAFLTEMVCCLFVTLFWRYAVSPTQAARHRWGEDHHSEPHRPAEVRLSRKEHYMSVKTTGEGENMPCGSSLWTRKDVFRSRKKGEMLSITVSVCCIKYYCWLGRTMRRLSLRCMKCTPWTCWSAPARGRSVFSLCCSLVLNP